MKDGGTNFPRGVQAFVLEAAERRRRLEDRLVRELEGAGFREVILPILDFASPYAGVTAEGDDRQYRLMDRSGELLSLRADFTPMAARSLAPRLASLPRPVTVFYRGDVVRDEATGVGRPREFAQVGAECYGDPSFETDARLLALLMRCVSDVARDRLRITLGYAGLLEKAASALAPSLVRLDGDRLATLLSAARERRASEVRTMLADAGAKPAAAEELARSLLLGFEPGGALFQQPILARAAAELSAALAEVERTLPGVSAVVDLAGTPAAPYYTGLTVSVDAVGAQGAIAAGGRYDGLMAHFGPPTAAFGFSIGVEALASAIARQREAAEPPRLLRIAVGKGRLLAEALPLLAAAGATFPGADDRRLLLADREGEHELLLLKDDDVPTYVAHGGADVGIVGNDRVVESGESVYTPLALPFGRCRLSLIARADRVAAGGAAGSSAASGRDGGPLKVGTKYGRFASRVFDERRIPHEIVPLAGSVELAAALGLTDVIVDLVETGATLAANGLVEVETLMPSQGVLIVGPRALIAQRARIAALVEKLRCAVEAAC